MPPDFWSSIHHLLLCSPYSNDSSECLAIALELIDRNFPQIDLQWLFLDTNNDYYLISALNTAPLMEECVSTADSDTIINAIQASHFDAAMILTTPGQSPYQLAYLCYLAGIPIRLGQSQEFGGGVLSHCIQPPLDPVSPAQYILHLLHAAGLAVHLQPTIA